MRGLLDDPKHAKRFFKMSIGYVPGKSLLYPGNNMQEKGRTIKKTRTKARLTL